jgi:outer membrane protein assembly factor BamE
MPERHTLPSHRGHLGLLLLSCCWLGACSSVDRVLPSKDSLPFVYRLDIQQGNVVTQEMLAQLQPGMDKARVRHIMGTPLLIDVFHSNRWDYLYTLQEGNSARQRRQVSLYFDGEKLERVEGDVRPAAGKLVVERKPDVEVAVPEADRRIIDRMRDQVGLGDTTEADKAARRREKEEERARKRAEEDARARAEALGTTVDFEREAERQRTQAAAEAALAEDVEESASRAVVRPEATQAEPGLFRRMMRGLGLGEESDTDRAMTLPDQELQP